ncbi:MAG: MFS transporter, partial [Bacilli bacterium]
GWLYVFSFIILYLLLEACYSINDIGYWSFITTLTSDEKRRGEILSWASVFLIASSYFVASIAPAITASNPKENMTILGTILIIFSFVSQLIFVLTMKERKETLPLTQEKSRIDFLQPMKILFSDRQLRLTTLVMFMISLAQFCVIGNSANYFYYEYGYGGFLDSGYQGSMFSGGMVSFIFIICYGLGYLISQICLPPLMKRYSKKKILLFSLIAMTGIYLLMFFFGFSSGNEISLFIMSFCIAFFYGLCYTIVSINTNDGVEYYQYHYHQRKDGTIQSFRAFGVILATAGQTGVFYIFMLLGGLSDINSSIAKAEAEKMSGELAFDSATSFNSYINNEIIHLNDITSSMWVYRSELTILPMLLVVASVLVTVFFVKVNDEKYFDSMVHSIQKQEIQNETI